MRGPDDQTHDLFSYVSPESRVRADHPLRRVRQITDAVFAWMKTVGLLRKLRHRGGPKVDWVFTFTAALYNVVRLRTFLPQAA